MTPPRPPQGLRRCTCGPFQHRERRPQFLGVANYGDNRPEVAAIYGSQFAPTGFHLNVKGLPPGGWTIAVYAWVTAANGFAAVSTVPIVIQPAGIVAIDIPGNFTTVDPTFAVSGWAIDPAAKSGTGIDTIHIWAHSANGSVPPVFLGVPGFGDRPDVTRVLRQPVPRRWIWVDREFAAERNVVVRGRLRP